MYNKMKNDRSETLNEKRAVTDQKCLRWTIEQISERAGLKLIKPHWEGSKSPKVLHTGKRAGPKAFKRHQGSDCHREAVDALIVLPLCTKDVGELQSQEHEAEKARNREMLLLVLQSVQFLARQGLPLRGDRNESDGNFS